MSACAPMHQELSSFKRQLHGCLRHRPRTRQKLTADYVIPYHEGELTAVAYDENGAVIARDTVRSFGDTANLVLTPDKTKLSADGSDLIYLEISAVDANGTFCANANNRVNVTVEAPVA